MSAPALLSSPPNPLQRYLKPKYQRQKNAASLVYLTAKRRRDSLVEKMLRDTSITPF